MCLNPCENFQNAKKIRQQFHYALAINSLLLHLSSRLIMHQSFFSQNETRLASLLVSGLHLTVIAQQAARLLK